MTPSSTASSPSSPSTIGVFALPDHLAAKAAPERIARDEERLRRIQDALDASVAAAEQTLAGVLARNGLDAQGRVEREARVDHARRRLRHLTGVRHEAVLGRMSPADGGEPLHIGRLGVHGPEGEVLMVDWRSEAARPFFAATRADPRGLASRRRYRWAAGRIRDYWDELLGEGAEQSDEERSPDEESALLEMLGRARTERMTSVLSTLAADQDAIIRAPSRGPLVVDGGPGTGKTVVALHRAAYLLHTEPRLGPDRGGVLVVGPHRPYLHYVADVLPGLGEDGVLTCTLADMVPEGEDARPEPDPALARLKGGRAMLGAIEAAIAQHEEPPRAPHLLETAWGVVELGPRDWEEAFAAATGIPHNLARGAILEEIAEITAVRLLEEHGRRVDVQELLEALEGDGGLDGHLRRAWPLLRAADVVATLYERPDHLRRCAPELGPEQVAALQRAEPRSWTLSDLPLLDAAGHRLGDPGAERERRRVLARRQDMVDEVALGLGEMISADSSEMQVMAMLRGEDLQRALAERVDVEVAPPDRLAGPFAHVVVDEAQELDDAQWAMVLRRCPSRSLTLVGDRAQASEGAGEGWRERLSRAGLPHAEIATLTVNYRTPAEIMAEAAPVIRAAVPGASVPTSIRETGVPVRHAALDELEAVLDDWRAQHEDGTAAVVGRPAPSRLAPDRRVRALTPELAKGLEFDLVVLVEPDALGEGTDGAAARYVAMTRATRELVILSGQSGSGR